jgi:hypothetical protein
MSLESSASTWDGISFWLVAIGAVLASLGAVAGIEARRLNRRLTVEKAATTRREKDLNDRAIADAGARAAEANARAKEAEAHAAEANLELAKFKAPRRLTFEQQQRIVGKLKIYGGQTFSLNVYNDPEALNLLAVQRTRKLRTAWRSESNSNSRWTS